MKARNYLIPVVLAGGSGTRLWPSSRKDFPKQFIKINASNETLLQATVKRFQSLDINSPIVICNEDHRFLTAEQLRLASVEKVQIILESVGKNTAPAIALASLMALREDKDSILLVLAADHAINDQKAFEKSVDKALVFAQQDKLVTFGVVPTQAKTGYGYIKKGSKTGYGFQIESFVEKPSLEKAEEYFGSEEYLWNSGMFMFKASRYLDELKIHAPEIYDCCSRAIESVDIDGLFVRVDSDEFSKCPSVSIDYAVMEKTKDAVVVELNAEWSDIGSWDAIWEIAPKDNYNNALIGDVISIDSKSCYVHSEERLVTLLNVQDLIVVDTKDAILIASKDHSQEVKKIVAELHSNGRKEHLKHRVVERPWGCFDSIDNGARYQVKRITVKPGAKLSVQMHYHRAEHWIVVSGTALITNGDKTSILSENQSTYIPAGVIHALENPGKIPLEIIEVQSGNYLGEDDIIRLEDKYGRV